MSEPGKKLLTVEEFEAMDWGDGPAPELIDGEITWGEEDPVELLPRGRHQRAAARLSARLSALDPDEPGEAGWWILPDVDVRLALRTLVRPDVGGWRRTRLPEIPEHAIDVVPDWVCEVLTPGREVHDLETKRTLYARYGVGWYWIVDAHARTLQAYENSSGRWLWLGTWTDGQAAAIPPFELELEVGTMFLPLPKKPE
ncbi:MAG: Uma2 family endonuclease [Myxococcota bacterium]